MISIPPPLAHLANVFEKEGVRLYGVGGLIRSSLLQLPVSDYDTCSCLRPEQVISLCARHGIHTVPTGLRFGTVTILMQDGFFTEHTTFRSDIYAKGGGHQPEAILFSDSLETDAFRRDFTVNAMYLDLITGAVIDPTGGREDLKNRLIRTTTRNPYLILQDDALRILRMVRFAARLNFHVEPCTLQAAKDCVEGLNNIAGERLRDEFYKLFLSAPKPLLYALETLDHIGAMDLLFPELTKGRGIEQRVQYHRYDVLHHAYHACAAMDSRDPVLKLAALLHDVGKPYALEKNLVEPARTPMLGHDRLGADISWEISARLRCTNADALRLSLLIRNHMYDLNGSAKESTLRGQFALWGRSMTEDLILLRQADVHGSGVQTSGPVDTAERWKRVLADMQREGAPFSEKELCCTGEDIIKWTGLPPGPEIGQMKRRLLVYCAKHPRENQKQRLARVVRNMMGALPKA